MRLASDSPRHAIELRLDTLVVHIIVQFALSKRSIVVRLRNWAFGPKLVNKVTDHLPPSNEEYSTLLTRHDYASLR
jgi:hypothetical protein